MLNTDITTTTSGGGVVFTSTLNSITAAAKTLTMTLGSGNATLGGIVGGATGGALGSLSVTTVPDRVMIPPAALASALVVSIVVSLIM